MLERAGIYVFEEAGRRPWLSTSPFCSSHVVTPPPPPPPPPSVHYNILLLTLVLWDETNWTCSNSLRLALEIWSILRALLCTRLWFD